MSTFREKIEGTNTFKNLNIVQRKITLSKTNRAHLEHGVNVARNIGIKRWLQVCQYSQRNMNIVQEIIKEHYPPKTFESLLKYPYSLLIMSQDKNYIKSKMIKDTIHKLDGKCFCFGLDKISNEELFKVLAIDVYPTFLLYEKGNLIMRFTEESVFSEVIDLINKELKSC